jgi:hypothetical protein
VAASSRKDSDFTSRTLAIWQPRYDYRLTDEDAREIAENVSGFFRLLLEWDRKQLHGDEAAEESTGDKSA